MIPDSNDQIRQNQMREIQSLKKQETTEDIVSDPMNVSKDSGNESDASISPPPNHTTPSPSIQQANSSSSHSLLINNNSLPPSFPVLHSHPHTHLSHSHPNGSHSHNHPNSILSHSHPNGVYLQNHPKSFQSSFSPSHQKIPNVCLSQSYSNSPPIQSHSKFTSILNKIIAQRSTPEEKTPQPNCCDQFVIIQKQTKYWR